MSDVRDDRGGEDGFRLSRRASAILAVALAVFIVGSVVAIVGLRAADRWVVVAVVERMGLEGLGVDPEEGQLFPGGLVGATEKSEVELQLGMRLRVALAPDTRVQLSPAPGRWFRRDVTIRVEKGIVRVTTARARGGVRVILAAAEARARTSGGTVAASREEATSTCFSVHEGELVVRPAGLSDETRLTAGSRACFYRDGRPSSSGPLDPVENDRLGALAASGMIPLAGP